MTKDKQRVLVVDDELLITQKVCDFLEMSGYDVDFALSGGACIRKIEQDGRFDVVVLDIELGDDSDHGGRVASEIERRFQLPIVFYTGHSDQQTIGLTRGAGSFGIVAKGPHDGEFLLASIETALTRWRAERDARAESERYRTILDLLPAPLWVSRNGVAQLEYANRAFRERFAVDAVESVAELFEEELEQFDEPVDGSWVTRGPVRDRRDGRRWMIAARPGPHAELISVLSDVTTLADRLDGAEGERERYYNLMREVNHRVKNNLTVVDSLIGLAERAHANESSLEMVRDQVRAVRLLHERLLESESQTEVDLAEYVTGIAEQAFPAQSRVTLRLDVEPVAISGKRALPLGLILAELASNAVKHAFATDGSEWFALRLQGSATAGVVILRIEHSGRPLPPDEEIAASGGSGMQIVRGLVSQLDGELRITRGASTAFEIVAPLVGPGEGGRPAAS